MGALSHAYLARRERLWDVFMRMTRYNPDRNRILRNIALLFLLIAPLAQGASAPAPMDQKESLDEVVVKGTRSELDELRNEMVRIEDRFNERYNELNPNHDFDTHCHVEARIGTNTKRRYCRAVYQEQALEREGHDHLEAMKEMGNGERPWAPPPPATVMIEARRKDYQNNIRNVVKKNPELLEMLRERYELGQRYEASQRKIFGSRAKEEDKSEALPATP
jgi:hypothetical protein